MKHPFRTILGAVLLAVLSSACAPTDPYTTRTRNSAVIGGAAGGIIGNNTGLGTFEGVLAGAAVGAILGEAANESDRRRKSASARDPRYHRYNNMNYRF